jgi:hypothetical protein
MCVAKKHATPFILTIEKNEKNEKSLFDDEAKNLSFIILSFSPQIFFYSLE